MHDNRSNLVIFMGKVNNKITLGILQLLETLEKIGLAKAEKPGIDQEKLEFYHNQLRVVETRFDELKKEYDTLLLLADRLYSEYNKTPQVSTIRKYSKLIMAKTEETNKKKSEFISLLQEI